MSSPARLLFAPSRRRSSRQERLATTTIREFDGGWNAIDNDLNLSSRFAKKLVNMYRASDGSLAIRYGTRLFADVGNQEPTTGTLGNDPLQTSALSNVVTVTHANHGLLSGHSVTLSGLVAFNGLVVGEINATHDVTVLTVNTYNITVATAATSSGSGGGAGGAYSHNNKEIAADIVNAIYFQDRIVGVDAAGVVFEVDSNGVSRIVFDADIAAKLVGAPAGWSATDFVSFAVFGGDLIICNGIDKPLIADFDVSPPTAPVQYLVDLGTGSNVNTPIARYVWAMDHYLLMAGNLLEPGVVYISNFDTSGTWLSDPAPNDAVNVDLSKTVTSQNYTIRGIGRFRDRVVVAFDDNFVLGDIGLYDATTGDHTPDFSDVIEQHGAVSHRSLSNLGNDLLSADLFGVPSLSRALFTGSIQPKRVSELIDPEIQRLMLTLSVATTEDRVFATYNQVQGQYFLFVPNANIGSTTETVCFVYTNIDTLKVKAWSEYRGWNWRCGFRSSLGRVFFGGGKKLYIYGASNDVILADFVDDYDFYEWQNATMYDEGDRVRDSVSGVVYAATSDHTSSASGDFALERTTFPELWEEYEGEAISFEWELPWADFDRRMNIKHSRYIGFDTKGTAQFTCQLFVDNIFEDKQNPGQLLPATLEMDFVGGEAAGFGGGMQPYGGGRRTSDERLWAWPSKFKIAKLRFFGSDRAALSFVAITIGYLDGSVRR